MSEPITINLDVKEITGRHKRDARTHCIDRCAECLNRWPCETWALALFVREHFRQEHGIES